jgi:hypothetical protein
MFEGAKPEDDPNGPPMSLPGFTGWWGIGWNCDPRETWLATGDASGELAALTQLGVDPESPEWGHQGLTAVTRPHRGHRLGLLVKVAMLEQLASCEPQLSRIITDNTDTNQHMIAINAALGYQVMDCWVTWELAVADAAASQS